MSSTSRSICASAASTPLSRNASSGSGHGASSAGVPVSLVELVREERDERRQQPQPGFEDLPERPLRRRPGAVRPPTVPPQVLLEVVERRLARGPGFGAVERLGHVGDRALEPRQQPPVGGRQRRPLLGGGVVDDVLCPVPEAFQLGPDGVDLFGPPVVVLPRLRGVEEEKPDRVRAELLDGGVGQHHVSLRRRHLLAFEQAHPHDHDSRGPLVGIEQLRVVQQVEREVIGDEVVGGEPVGDRVPVLPLRAE